MGCVSSTPSNGPAHRDRVHHEKPQRHNGRLQKHNFDSTASSQSPTTTFDTDKDSEIDEYPRPSQLPLNNRHLRTNAAPPSPVAQYEPPTYQVPSSYPSVSRHAHETPEKDTNDTATILSARSNLSTTIRGLVHRPNRAPREPSFDAGSTPLSLPHQGLAPGFGHTAVAWSTSQPPPGLERKRSLIGGSRKGSVDLRRHDDADGMRGVSYSEASTFALRMQKRSAWAQRVADDQVRAGGRGMPMGWEDRGF